MDKKKDKPALTDEEIKQYLELKNKLRKVDPKTRYKETKIRYAKKMWMCETCNKEYATRSYYAHLRTKKHLAKVAKTEII